MGMLISTHKEVLLKAIEHQLTLGPEGLAKEDGFLLECNFDELTMTTGEQQEYWLLAIQAAQEVSHICAVATATQQQHNTDTMRRWALSYVLCYSNMAYAQRHSGDLNNSQGCCILEGESPLAAVPTVTLFCIPHLWCMKTPFWLNLSSSSAIIYLIS
jgi:hypothetical protein